MFHILIPSNVITVFEFIIPVFTFDILDSSYTTELLLDFDYEAQEKQSQQIFDQIKDLGYDTYNSWKLLGSISIYLVFYFVMLLFLLLTSWLLTSKFQSFYKNLRTNLLFSYLITLSLESYLIFIICSYMVLYHPLYTANGEVTSVMLAGMVGAIWTLVIPGMLVYILRQDMDTIKSLEFRDKWGAFYDEIRLNGNKSPVWFNFWFCLRRILFYVMVEYFID